MPVQLLGAERATSVLRHQAAHRMPLIVAAALE